MEDKELYLGDLARDCKDSLYNKCPVCDKFHELFNIYNIPDFNIKECILDIESTSFIRILPLILIKKMEEC